MTTLPSGRFWLVAAALGLAFFFLLVELLGPGATVPASIGPSPTSTSFDLASGLVTVSEDQNVTGTAYWETYCGSTNPQNSCLSPVGIAYVPALGSMVVTEAHDMALGGTNAIVEIDPNTLEARSSTPLNCSPNIPFYPGIGGQLFIPCFNDSTSAFSTLLAVNAETGSVVASFSLQADIDSLAYDSQDGMVYLGVGSNSLATVDPVHDVLVRSTSITGASFQATYITTGSAFQLAFDPAHGQLLLPSAAGGLLAVDPATGAIEARIPFPSNPMALAVDSGMGQLFVAGRYADSVQVYNASDFALEASISVPACIQNVCGIGDVEQILLDPVHGDAYLLSGIGLDTLNLSKLTLISAILDYGNGRTADAVYLSGGDRVIGTYAALGVGPGFVVQLNHGSLLSLTRLLWLSPDLAILALASSVGSAVALLSLWRAYRHRSRFTRDPSEP